MGLGSYPEVSLADARILAADARKMTAVGKDPLAARDTERTAHREAQRLREAKRMPFAKLAADFMVAHGAGWSEKWRLGWLRKLEQLELRAAIKLLLISVVLLPVLPNQGYGPEQVLNPYHLWLLVVMVAGISFTGYFAIKIAGPRIGSLLTGVFGGLASSTALTVSFARMGRESPSMQSLLAAGVALANTTMFVRLWLIVFLLNRGIGEQLALPLGCMAVAGLFATWMLWRSRIEDGKPGAAGLSNPFELGMAIKFATLLALVMVASKLLQSWAGSTGLYLLAAVAGLADVDAVALSMAQMGGKSVALGVAATAITIAAFVNTGVKVALVSGLCGGLMARRIALSMGMMVLAGAAGLSVRWLGV